ncbi:MAG: MFS transporter [Dehalococcoidia bacterium]|nr:MFS transporter [Dehalococcoidia bacterium]
MARLQFRRGDSAVATPTERGDAPRDAALESAPAAELDTLDAPTAEAAPTVRHRIKLPRTFDSFYDREFRWFYASMLGHMASMNMQLVIRGALAYALTNSYAALGLVGLAGALPQLFISVFGGVIADRKPKKTVMQLGQAASLVNAMILAACEFLGVMTMEILLISAAAQGITMALMMPSRQAMLPDVVGHDRLMNAVALNMAGMNTMRLFAPALGGAIVAVWGFGWGFTAMSVLYVIAIICMSQLTWRPASAPGEEGQSLREVGKSAFADIAGGITYIWRDHKMFIILSFAFISSAFGMPLQFLLPGYAAEYFADSAEGGVGIAGLFLSVSAIGALGGALWLASIQDKNRGWMLLGGGAVLGVGIILFALMDSFILACAAMVVFGLGSSFRMGLSQGLLHSYVENAYRGRVMAVFMTQMAMMQFTTFFVGVAAEFVGIRVAIGSLGVLLIITAGLYAAFVPTVRRLQ